MPGAQVRWAIGACSDCFTWHSSPLVAPPRFENALLRNWIDALMDTNSNQSVMEEISSHALLETDSKEVKSSSSKTSEDDFNNVTLESKTNCSGSVSKPDTPEQQQANSPPASHQPESPVNDHPLDQSSKDDSPKPSSFEFEDQDSPPANIDNVSNKPSTTEPAANSPEPAGKNYFFN